jgi:ribokinase
MKKEAFFDVVCMGSATMDVFVETEKQSAITQTVKGQETPFITFKSGEKVIVKNLHFEVGGGGTNTAACFAKLSLVTGYCGAVGKDNNGDTVLHRLVQDGVAFLGSIVAEQTNYSVILESALLKDRTILVYKGASEHLVEKDVKPFHARWLYTSSLAGTSFIASLALIKRHRAHGGLVATNPSNYQIEHDPMAVKELLTLTDVAIMNREEAAALVGEGSVEEQLKRIRLLGPVIVAITDGKNGSTIGNAMRAYHAAPTPNLPVRETTGAGDCFASTVLAALILDCDLEMALRWAMCNVEEHITHVGAKAGFLTRDELMHRAAKDKRKMTSLY